MLANNWRWFHVIWTLGTLHIEQLACKGQAIRIMQQFVFFLILDIVDN